MNFIDKVCSRVNLQVSFVPNRERTFFQVFLANKYGKEICTFKVSHTLILDENYPSLIFEELATLFYNGICPTCTRFHVKQDFFDFIDSNFPDKSPIAKADRVLMYIQNKSNHDGQFLDISDLTVDEKWRTFFINNFSELDFYLKYLIDNEFLVIHGSHDKFRAIALTVKGIERVINLNETSNSKTCFVAMSFDEEMFQIYNLAIRTAIIETGFEPFIVNEKKDIPSDTTINDAILAAIKKSKFTIADFTNHKHGVYFEAAYALGRGQKVIYTCRHDEISKAHFDSRNYSHIVWKDAEDLKKQLIDKIEVFIIS